MTQAPGLSQSTDRSREAAGTAAAVGAYTLWGLVPLYWPLLDPADPPEVLAHRVVWTLVFVLVLLPITGSVPAVRAALADRRVRWLLLLAMALVSVNWGTFIWAVVNGYVLESALGYFINPLISVLLGVVVLGERLRPAQWVAVGIAAVGVAVLTIAYGRPPFIALTLALSFGFYGLVKKKAGVDAIPSLAIETAYALPFAVGYLILLGLAGTGSFLADGPAQSLLLAGAGVITAVPLLLFGAAAIRIPLARLGILQYIGPALQFVIGLLIFGEEMSPARWVGFVTVWLALAVFTADALSHTARRRHAIASAGHEPRVG